MKLKTIGLASLALVLAHPAQARKHHRHRHHHHRYHYDHSSTSLAGQPYPLQAKISEIISACGSHVISGFRRGAHVAGTNRLSNHARNHADDISGNPSCIYAHLHGWPGGYSIDYGRVHHVHISYDHSHEWGARFAHYTHLHHHYAGIQ